MSNTAKVEDKAVQDKNEQQLDLAFEVEFIPKEFNDISGLTVCELMENISYFSEQASSASEKGDAKTVAYYIMVIERYLNQAKFRIVTSV